MDFTRILVLGATGRIGAILRRCWGDDRVLWQTRAALPGTGWVKVDPLSDPDGLARAARGCAAILCLAGVVPARAAAGSELGDNIALAEAAVRAGAVVQAGAASGARVFLASSAAVYGNQAGLLEECAPLLGQSAYGRAKMDMEARAAALGAELGVVVCALRIGNIAGIDSVLGGWKPGFRLDRFGDGRTPRRSYIGVQTLAKVLEELMQAQDLPAALNIAAPGLVEMGALLDAAGLGWEARPAPEAAIPEVVLCTKALARFAALPAPARAEALVAEWWAIKEPAP